MDFTLSDSAIGGDFRFQVAFLFRFASSIVRENVLSCFAGTLCPSYITEAKYQISSYSVIVTIMMLLQQIELQSGPHPRDRS